MNNYKTGWILDLIDQWAATFVVQQVAEAQLREAQFFVDHFCDNVHDLHVYKGMYGIEVEPKIAKQ